MLEHIEKEKLNPRTDRHVMESEESWVFLSKENSCFYESPERDLLLHKINVRSDAF